MGPDELDAEIAAEAVERRRRRVAAAREWIARPLDPDPKAMAFRVGEGQQIVRFLLEELGPVSGHEVSFEGHGDKHVPVCATCEWTGQGWDTRRGAEIEAEWHEDHPGTGEVPAIEENRT